MASRVSLQKLSVSRRIPSPKASTLRTSKLGGEPRPTTLSPDRPGATWSPDRSETALWVVWLLETALSMVGSGDVLWVVRPSGDGVVGGPAFWRRRCGWSDLET